MGSSAGNTVSNGLSGYQGHGFHKDLKNGKSSGLISVSSGVIKFTCDAKSTSFPIEGADFSLGGASDRLVFIRHKTCSDWSFYTSDRAILNDEHLQNNDSISKQLINAKRTRWFNHSVLMSVLAVMVLVPIMAVLFMDVFTGIAAKQVHPAWEHKLGETVYAQYQIGERLMPAETTDKVLTPVVQPLLAVLPASLNPESTEDIVRFKPQIAIVDDPEINAFALPGGFIVINSGLILAADSADEVLGVLAHELSHVTEQHSLRNIISAASVYLTIDLILGDVSGLLAMVADAAPLLISQQFSRDFERDADAKGFELLTKAKIDPNGLSKFFEKLIKEQEKQLEKIDDDTTREIMAAAEGLLSTHPATEERIVYIQSLAEKHHGPYVELDDVFRELKEAVKKFVVTKSEEENEK